jgi:hypothetical protein
MADGSMGEQLRRVAQRNHSALLSGLAQVSQKRVADLIGVSEATLSTMKNEQLERFAAFAAACGLKVVAITDQTYKSAHVDALKTLASIALDRDQNSGWGDLESGK